ncbi:hypothetical protein [Streptosporangium sp. 'caverna']|uniref:hypothetical protein n=1 Tax=Streptosporangium sp. 'caverna' TaxID=2202249 RepID=UPI0013A6C3F2|nr:hypothetical protein [Streptosporangium sp. 'caverna']
MIYRVRGTAFTGSEIVFTRPPPTSTITPTPDSTLTPFLDTCSFSDGDGGHFHPEMVSQGVFTDGGAAQTSVNEHPRTDLTDRAPGPAMSADSHRTVSAQPLIRGPTPLSRPLGPTRREFRPFRGFSVVVVVIVVVPAPVVVVIVVVVISSASVIVVVIVVVPASIVVVIVVVIVPATSIIVVVIIVVVSAASVVVIVVVIVVVPPGPAPVRVVGVAAGPLNEGRARAAGSLGRGSGTGGLSRHRHGDDEGGGHHCTGDESVSDLGHVEHPMSY